MKYMKKIIGFLACIGFTGSMLYGMQALDKINGQTAFLHYVQPTDEYPAITIIRNIENAEFKTLLSLCSKNNNNKNIDKVFKEKLTDIQIIHELKNMFSLQPTSKDEFDRIGKALKTGVGDVEVHSIPQKKCCLSLLDKSPVRFESTYHKKVYLDSDSYSVSDSGVALVDLVIYHTEKKFIYTDDIKKKEHQIDHLNKRKNADKYRKFCGNYTVKPVPPLQTDSTTIGSKWYPLFIGAPIVAAIAGIGAFIVYVVKQEKKRSSAKKTGKK
jgi:hypothetical protein